MAIRRIVKTKTETETETKIKDQAKDTAPDQAKDDFPAPPEAPKQTRVAMAYETVPAEQHKKPLGRGVSARIYAAIEQGHDTLDKMMEYFTSEGVEPLGPAGSMFWKSKPRQYITGYLGHMLHVLGAIRVKN